MASILKQRSPKKKKKLSKTLANATIAALGEHGTGSRGPLRPKSGNIQRGEGRQAGARNPFPRLAINQCAFVNRKDTDKGIVHKTKITCGYKNAAGKDFLAIF